MAILRAFWWAIVGAIVIIVLALFVWPGFASNGHPVWAQAQASSTAPAPTTAQPAQPTVQPTQQPTQAPAPVVPTAQPASIPPFNIPPQPQIGHPSLYLETGVPCVGTSGMICTDVDAHTKTWTVDVISGTTAIIGGFKVDGVSNGVYKAVQGPVKLMTTVTDGFLAIIKSEWANNEFCFRTGQARQYNWAHAHESPLSGWTACQ